jgi:hypothetical protein
MKPFQTGRIPEGCLAFMETACRVANDLTKNLSWWYGNVVRTGGETATMDLRGEFTVVIAGLRPTCERKRFSSHLMYLIRRKRSFHRPYRNRLPVYSG